MTSKAEYLKRYLEGGGGDAEGGEGKKKRKRKKDKSGQEPGVVKVKKLGSGIVIHDEDVNDWKYGGKDYRVGREDEAPVVVDAEGRGPSSLEAERGRQYLGIREDGSGWAVVADETKGGGADGRINDGDEDLSPPRPGRHDSDEDLSPPRPGRHDSDEDLSPPRPGRHDSDEDLSPPRLGRHDSDEDLSPPRRGRQESDEDLSPRRLGRHDSDEDLSPPRRGRQDSDEERGEGDISPLRRTRGGDADLSPPRRGGGGEADGDPSPLRGRPRMDRSTPHHSPPLPTGARGKTMTDGTSTGLVDAATVVREAAEKRAVARARVMAMSEDQSGRGAETQFRDKATGQMIDAAEMRRRQELAAAKPKERERPVWATGVAQARETMEAHAAFREEAENPFARADIDPRAEEAQRSAVRFGDPMAHLARKKAVEVLPSVVAGISEEALKKSGFRIPQEIPAHSWIKRGVGAPSNRYGIKPGRHWDGVDRSTGFEQELFKAQNDRRTRDQSAWKYVQAVWE